MSRNPDYKALTQFATVRQLEILEALEKHGSIRKTAKALGLAKSTIDDSLDRLRRTAAVAAAREGHAPGHFDSGVAPGNVMGKVTVQRDAAGNILQTWERQHPDDAAREAAIRASIEALSNPIRGMAPVAPAPAHVDTDLLAVYPLGDPHIGMYAWAKEAGEDFDLDIAREITLGAVDRLVQSAPPAHTAIVLALGDVFHMNDQTNQTPAHKHQLDVDSRFVKVLGVGIEIFRHAVLRARQKHARVIVRFLPGNHDPQAVWALSYAIAAYFENDPGVEVDLSPAAHWFFRFDKVLIGSTHGDKSKAPQLAGVMACDRARDWGETLHRYWYCGHVHHSSKQELPGVTVETFRTLAAPDSYAAAYGYRAGRDMCCIVLHRRFGEVERHRCDVGMLDRKEESLAQID
jgi:hypothetical protein